MNSMPFETKLGNCMGTKCLNCVGTNRPSWVRIVWEQNFLGYETSGKPTKEVKATKRERGGLGFMPKLEPVAG